MRNGFMRRGSTILLEVFSYYYFHDNFGDRRAFSKSGGEAARAYVTSKKIILQKQLARHAENHPIWGEESTIRSTERFFKAVKVGPQR